MKPESHSSWRQEGFPQEASGGQIILDGGPLCHITPAGAASAKVLLSADVSGELDFLQRKEIHIIPPTDHCRYPQTTTGPQSPSP